MAAASPAPFKNATGDQAGGMIVEYVDQILMFCAGMVAVWGGLVPSRHEPDPARRENLNRMKGLMRGMGPLLMIIAIVLAIGKYNGFVG